MENSIQSHSSSVNGDPIKSKRVWRIFFQFGSTGQRINMIWSALYCKVLIIFAIAFYLADTEDYDINITYLHFYLYVGSLVVLSYFYLDFIMQKFKAKQAADRQSGLEVEKVSSGSSMDEDLPSPKFTYGNLYLKSGTVRKFFFSQIMKYICTNIKSLLVFGVFGITYSSIEFTKTFHSRIS